MQTFYFDLIDDILITDETGHSCKDEEEAREHGDFIAQRIGTEKPEVAELGMYVSVRNAAGAEVHRSPVISAGPTIQ